VGLYRCETWSLTLREELRAFENMVLRDLTKEGQVMGRWRKLHNEELHDLYSLPSIIRIMKCRRNMCKLLVGKPEGKGPLESPRCRWVDGIKMNLAEIG
jgi:hypothetical protein